MSRIRPIVLAVLLAAMLLVARGARAQEDAGLASIQTRLPGVLARLESLKPGEPRGYFELGEDVAAESDLRPARVLAVRLFGLAFVLEYAKGDKADRSLLASCCLALAPLSDTDGDRRWLRALADAVGEAGANRASTPKPQESTSSMPTAGEDSALDAATVLGLARAGNGQRAARLLARPDVAALLDRYERLLSPALLPGGLGRVRAANEEWPGCQTCRNKRVVKDASGIRLCPRCAGRPGPKMADSELILHLRTEAALLSGVQKSWAASTLVDAGAPVRDADPAELAATLGIDPEATIFRAGQWKRGEAAKAAAGQGPPAGDAGPARDAKSTPH